MYTYHLSRGLEAGSNGSPARESCYAYHATEPLSLRSSNAGKDITITATSAFNAESKSRCTAITDALIRTLFCKPPEKQIRSIRKNMMVKFIVINILPMQFQFWGHNTLLWTLSIVFPYFMFLTIMRGLSILFNARLLQYAYSSLAYRKEVQYSFFPLFSQRASHREKSE